MKGFWIGVIVTLALCVLVGFVRWTGVGVGIDVRHIDLPAIGGNAQRPVDGYTDLMVRFLRPEFIRGRKEWLYQAENGRVYQMDVPRQNEADRIRLYPDGRVVWARQ